MLFGGGEFLRTLIGRFDFEIMNASHKLWKHQYCMTRLMPMFGRPLGLHNPIVLFLQL